MAERGIFSKFLVGFSKKKQSQKANKSRAKHQQSKAQEHKTQKSSELTLQTTSSDIDDASDQEGPWEDVVESYEEKQEIEYVKRQVQRKATGSTKSAVETKRSLKSVLAKPKSPSKSPFASAFYSRSASHVKSTQNWNSLSETSSSFSLFLKDNSYEDMLVGKVKTDIKLDNEGKYKMAELLGVQGLFPKDGKKTDISEHSVESLIEMDLNGKLNLDDEEVSLLNERFVQMPKSEKRRFYRCKQHYKIPQEIEDWQVMGEKLADAQEIKTVKGKSTEENKLWQTLNQKVALWKGNITELEVDGIVNSASSILLSNRSGVSEAIRRNAGPLLDYELRKIWYTYVGDVVHTAGYCLPAKYILHTSGPPSYWKDAEKALRNCYLSCLERMKQLQLKTLAFCCIGTGAKGVDKDMSARIALETTHEWLLRNHNHVDKVVFCIFEEFLYATYRNMMQEVFPVIPGDFAKRASLPPEILRMDSRSRDLYLKALEEGEAKVHNIRVMVVGHFDVGKTTLTKRLLEEDVDINTRASTDGIEVHVKRCRVKLKTGEWQVQKGLHKDDSSTRLASVVHQVSMITSVEMPPHIDVDEISDDLELESSMLSQKSTPDNSILMSASAGTDEIDARPLLVEKSDEVIYRHGSNRYISNESILSDNDSPLMQELELLVQRVSSTELEDVNNYADLSIWDFAGQYAFYGTHQIFLTPRAVYLLVIDLSKHIYSIVENDTCFVDDAGVQKSMRISEFVEFWLKSIYFYTKEEATVILVGTHADKLKKENRLEIAQKVFQDLRDSIIGTEYSYCLTGYEVIIDNSIVDKELDKLKSYIFEVARSKVDYWGKSVPAKWLTLERSIGRLRENGTKIIKRSYVEELNQKSCVPLNEDELEICLQYQHECGLILYFSEDGLQNYIVLDPQWLIDGFKCFITTEMFVRNDPRILPLWKKFNKQGILDEEFIDISWCKNGDKQFHQHKDHLLKLMEKLDIIARPASYMDDEFKEDKQCIKHNEAANYYFTPCMLKEKPERGLLDTTTIRNSTSTHKICYNFKSGFVPPAIFNRLLAACMSKWEPRKRGRKQQVLLFCGCGVFDLDSSRIHHLTIYLIDSYIQMWVTRFSDKGEFPDRSKCDEVRSFIESTLIRLCSNNYSHESFQTFIKCPKSSPYDSDGMLEIQLFEINKEFCCSKHDEDHHIKSSEVLRGWTDITESSGYIETFLYRSPSDMEISTMSQRIGVEWEQIGYQLCLKKPEIDQIKLDNQNATNRISAMLQMWRNYDRQATFETLKEAIKAAKGDIETIFDGFS